MTNKVQIKHRDTARVLMYSPNKTFLLLKTHFDPEVGLPPRWLTPGGGIDQGETAPQAAIREVHEETGLILEIQEIGDPVLITSGRWDWADGVSYHTYTDTIYEFKTPEFEIDTSGFTQDERRDVLEYRWWSLEEVLASDEPLGPHELRELISNRYK